MHTCIDTYIPTQEGHTAHASKEDALACATEMLQVYADAARDLLGVRARAQARCASACLSLPCNGHVIIVNVY